MNIRKIAAILSLVTALSFSACNSSTPSTGSPAVSESPARNNQTSPSAPSQPSPTEVTPQPTAPVIVSRPPVQPSPLPSPLPGMEPPASYSMDQLIQRAKSSNFDSQVAFQQFVQAKLSAQNAVLNLLPHFSMMTILNVASLNFFTIAKSVGDLVPFLLPSHWFHARGARFQSDAEYDGWVLMRADSVNIVEGLAFAVARDQDIIQLLYDDEDSVRQIRDEIIQREHSGLMQVGSSDDITSVINGIDQAISLLDTNIREERAALAQASGFQNPDAIAGITGVPNDPIDGAQPPDTATLADQVLKNSVELRQMDALIEMSKWNRKASYFNWLDPSGDPSGGIGFGLGDYLAIGRSQQQEVQIKREQVRSILMEKTTVTLDDANQTLQAYGLASDGADIQVRRISRLTQDLHSGIAFALSDLVDALEKQSSNEVQRVGDRFAYYEIQSRIQRLTFTGPYADLPNGHESP